MTISARNRIILSGTALVAVFAAIFVYSVATLFRMAPTQIFDFAGETPIAPLSLVLFCELFFCIATLVVLYVSFRKTSSAEIFFFMLFVVSMSFDALKMVHLVIDATSMPPYFGVLVSRIIYFAHFLGPASLFASGLFATGMRYERLEIVLISTLLLSFTLAATIPIDMTQLEPWFVMRHGYSREIRAVSILLYLFAFANFLLAAYQSRNRNHLIIAAGLALSIGGREILFYRLDVISVIFAFVLLVFGSTIFGERTHEVYLWS